MNIDKRIQCLRCLKTIEKDGKCDCGTVAIINNNVISEGKLGIDYRDISPVLLNE